MSIEGNPRIILSLGGRESHLQISGPKGERLSLKGKRKRMNYPAASCGVSKTARYEASFGEYYPERFKRI